MKKQITTLLALAVAQLGLAQTGVTVYGYAKGEFAFDSRQVVAAREANYIDLASPKLEENDVANFKGWGIESRLGVKAVGPEFFGMKSEAVIEGHFFGNSDATTNEFALRHAYVQLSNDNVEVLVGQYWHPMFVTNVSPGTYNFNAGSPFQPFNRSPQVRFSTKGNVRFTAAAISERDFVSTTFNIADIDENGNLTRVEGSNAAKSAIPTFHAQAQFGDDSKFVGGLGINYKTTRNLYNIDGKGRNLGAFNFLAYAKANLGNVATWKAYANYGQNPSELLQLGGVAIDEKGDLYNNNTLALWTEFSGEFSPSVEWGVFGGYTKDYGFDKQNILFGAFNFSSIGYVPVSSWRVSPRVGFKSGNTKLGVELDYTSTTYGYYQSMPYYVEGFGDNSGSTKKYEGDATGNNFRVSLSLTQTF